MNVQRFKTADTPCPICSGWDRMPRDKGIRCSGYIDGDFICCSREEHAGRLSQNAGGAFAHKRFGPCLCGKTHSAAVRDIAEAPRARRIEQYPYRGLDGQLVYEVVRLDPKGFRQRRPGPDGEWIWKLDGIAPLLYRLPEVVAAVAAGDPIWVAEGERDVHALEAAGQVATTNSGGAGKFPAAMAKHLAGADVTIVQDKDEPGRAHGRAVAVMLGSVAKSVRIVEAKSGKDARDHLEAGHRVSDFVPVWPLEELRKRDPAEWKRSLLRESLQMGEPFEDGDDIEATLQKPAPPHWPTGLSGGAFPLERLEGWTVIAGDRGSAKSYFALGSAMSAAVYGGWEVFYVNCEMDPFTLATRVVRFPSGERRPGCFHIVRTRYGCSIEGLIEYLSPRMTERKTLLVLDSMTSFVDQFASMNPRDPLGMGENKRLCMWLLNLVNESHGQIAAMTLSETNASGGVKFRMADYKANIVLSMSTSDSKDEVKYVEVLKDRTRPSRAKFSVRLDWGTSRLVAASEGEVSHD